MTTTRPPLTVQTITDDPLVNRIQEVGSDAIVRTSWWKHRANSATSAAQVVVQVANLGAFLLADVHWGITVAVAIIVGIAEVILQATSKTPVTPHVVETLVNTARTPAREGGGLPAYSGPTTAQD